MPRKADLAYPRLISRAFKSTQDQVENSRPAYHAEIPIMTNRSPEKIYRNLLLSAENLIRATPGMHRFFSGISKENFCGTKS